MHLRTTVTYLKQIKWDKISCTFSGICLFPGQSLVFQGFMCVLHPIYRYLMWRVCIHARGCVGHWNMDGLQLICNMGLYVAVTPGDIYVRGRTNTNIQICVNVVTMYLPDNNFQSIFVAVELRAQYEFGMISSNFQIYLVWSTRSSADPCSKAYIKGVLMAWYVWCICWFDIILWPLEICILNIGQTVK